MIVDYIGNLGDCWLLSALAALSEYPNKIQETFLTDTYNPRGIYYAKLYNPSSRSFIKMYIDDYLPVNEQNKLIFTQPNGNECWVLLLEKLFAKYIGSYSGLDGGFPLYALHILTGDPVHQFSLKDNQWKQLEMHISNDFKPNLGDIPAATKPVNASTTSPTPLKAGEYQISDIVSFYHSNSIPMKSNDEMFNVLYAYCNQGYIMAAATNKDVISSDDIEKKLGLVAGHAYTILGVYKPKLTTSSNIKLLKMRNPWYVLYMDMDMYGYICIYMWILDE